MTTGAPAPARWPVLLVAHGSADPRAAATTRALARAVAAARPGAPVRCGYLDHAGPRPATVLAALQRAGYPAAIVVPLLLTSAYHHRFDLPAALARQPGGGSAPVAGVPGPVTGVLGPVAGVLGPVAGVLGPVAGQVPAQLVEALAGRLNSALAGRPSARPSARPPARPPAGVDAVVLACAGTRDEAARESVGQVADALADSIGVPCRVGYASAAHPTAAGAVTDLSRHGYRWIAMASYFLAPGRLYRAAVAGARTAGAVAAAEPLAGDPALVRLILRRIAEVAAG